MPALVFTSVTVRGRGQARGPAPTRGTLPAPRPCGNFAPPQPPISPRAPHLPVFRKSDIPLERWRPGAESRTLLGRAHGSETLTVIESTVDVGTGPPSHRHDAEEAFHVLEGAIRAEIDGEELVAYPGDTLQVPSNAVHSFTSVGDVPARLIVVFPIHDPLSPDHSIYLEGAAPDTSPTDPAR